MSGLPDMVSMVSDMLSDAIETVPPWLWKRRSKFAEQRPELLADQLPEDPGPFVGRTKILTLGFSRGIVVGIMNNEVQKFSVRFV